MKCQALPSQGWGRNGGNKVCATILDAALWVYLPSDLSLSGTGSLKKLALHIMSTSG